MFQYFSSFILQFLKLIAVVCLPITNSSCMNVDSLLKLTDSLTSAPAVPYYPVNSDRWNC